jgi:hypothetical protein
MKPLRLPLLVTAAVLSGVFLCKEQERADRLEAMIDRMSETIVELRANTAESNGLLRSAYQIAKRDGIETNWDAFRNKLEAELNRQFDLMKKQGIKPL